MTSTTSSLGNVETPEAGSLRDILLKHRRQRLYVHPLLWSEDHVRLLDCSPIRCAKSVCACFGNAPFAHTLLSADDYAAAFSIYNSLKRLVLSHSRDVKIRQLISFLAQSVQVIDGGNVEGTIATRITTATSLPISYGHKTVASLPCAFVAQAHHSNGSKSNFAFLDRTWIRKKCGTAIYIRQQLRNHISSTTQRGLWIDPYYMAILIALAQGFAPVCSEGMGVLVGPVYLLTTSKRRDSLILYTASVRREYLRKFDEPYRSYTEPLSISQHEVALDDLNSIINIMYCGLGERTRLIPLRSPELNVNILGAEAMKPRDVSPVSSRKRTPDNPLSSKRKVLHDITNQDPEHIIQTISTSDDARMTKKRLRHEK